MPHKIGFVTNSGGKLAHQNMLQVVKEFAEANGWAVLRFIDNTARHELILKAPGLSGLEEIFVGMRTYESVAADYYNLTAAGFVGYVPGNDFASQPGAILRGVPAHNQRIDYWLTLNGQRLVLAMKVGTPVYESMYLGKMLPYARPSQYPYPLVVGGMLSSESGTRFSDVTYSCWVKGGTERITGGGAFGMSMRFNDGVWKTPAAYPWNNDVLCGNSSQLRDTDGVYPLTPVVLCDGTSGLFGELDGVFHISGFNNAVENTLLIDGKQHVVMQDVWRTTHIDYYAIQMDT